MRQSTVEFECDWRFLYEARREMRDRDRGQAGLVLANWLVAPKTGQN